MSILCKYLIPFLALIFVGCEKQSDAEERNKAIVEQYLQELVNQGDFSNVEEIISPDFTAYVNGEEVPVKGVDMIVSMFEEWNAAISNGILIEEEVIAEGNVVAVRWSETGTHDKADYMGVPPQNRAYKYYGMSFYRIEDGKVVETHIVADFLKLLTDLGGLPGE